MILTAFIVLIVVVAILSGLLVWQTNESRRERAKMLNLIVAKTPQEAISLAVSDEAKKTPPVNKASDLVPEDSLTQDQLQEMIKKGII